MLHTFPSTLHYTPKGLGSAEDSNLYGTTDATSNVMGTVFETTSSGSYRTRATFNYGVNGNPYAAPILLEDGTLIGTSFGGGANGYGTVYGLAPSDTVTTLHTFNYGDGAYPGSLIQGSDGNFYGTTAQGGSGGYGTIYRITRSGRLTTIANCGVSSCSGPNDLVIGRNGDIYGSSSGSSSIQSHGTIFQVTPKYKTLATFPIGEYPRALSLGADGNLYGITDDFNGTQRFVRSDSEGSLTFLGKYHFQSAVNRRLILAPNGNFYGTTFIGNTVFSLTPKGAAAIIYTFKKGSFPDDIVLGLDGNLYGTTWAGGATDGGVLYRLALQ